METKVTHFNPPAQWGRHAAIIGAIIVCIGAFLSWGTVDNVTVTGMDGDGKLTFTMALIALVILFIRKISIWWPISLGVVAEAIGVIQNINMDAEIAALKNIFASSLTGPNINGYIGVGVYLTMVGAALIIFASLFQWIKNRKR